MKYTFDKNIPYVFKDVTGIEDEYKIGWSIFENGKMIGGIMYYVNKTGKTPESIFNIIAIEIIPELRNLGKGTDIVKYILTEHDCINIAVQEEKALNFWRKLGAKEYMAVASPEEARKDNPKSHTLCLVLGRTRFDTLLLRDFFLELTHLMGATRLNSKPVVDFSANKISVADLERYKF